MINREECNSKLIELAKQINIEIDPHQVEKFYKYMILLLEWNEKINLTAITDVDEIILKHFIDSLTIIKYINETVVHIVPNTIAIFNIDVEKFINPSIA